MIRVVQDKGKDGKGKGLRLMKKKINVKNSRLNRTIDVGRNCVSLSVIGFIFRCILYTKMELKGAAMLMGQLKVLLYKRKE